MAKSQRSKVKKRLRQCRGEHYYQTVGKQKLVRISARLNDPTFDMKKDFGVPTNAFLDPKNMAAVFPQIKKATIMDFRSHKMENGGLTATNVFRKHYTPGSIKSKYVARVVTAEELASGEKKSLLVARKTKVAVVEEEEDVAPTVDELTALAAKMKISKAKKAAKKDVEMKETPKVSIKSKPIAKARCK